MASKYAAPPHAASQLRPPSPLGADEHLVFLHIFKTAGTSTRIYVERHFRFDEILRCYVAGNPVLEAFIPKLEEMTRNESRPKLLRRKRLFVGHMTYGTSRLLSPHARIMTMLRNPIDRTISNYYQIRRNAEGRLVDKKPVGARRAAFLVRVRGQDLEAFIAHASARGRRSAIWNRQVRVVSGDHSRRDFGMDAEGNLPSRAGGKAMKNDGEILDLAIRRLRAMDFVGITERFDESMLLLAYTFGWAPMRQELRLNTRSQRGTRDVISAACRARLESLNQLDRELYEAGVRMFEERLAAMRSDLAPGRSGQVAFDEVRRVLEERHGGLRRRFRTYRTSIAADDAGWGDGWHEVESDAERRFRWSGPDTGSELRLWLRRRRPQMIRFHVAHWMSDETLEGVQLVVDGQHVPVSRRQLAGHVMLVEGVLPARDGTVDRPTVVRLVVPATLRPADLRADSTDRRLLGLAIAKVESLGLIGRLAARMRGLDRRKD